MTVVFVILVCKFYSQQPQEALNLLFTEECYWVPFYMPLYTLFTQFAEGILVQISNKIGLQKIVAPLPKILLPLFRSRQSNISLWSYILSIRKVVGMVITFRDKINMKSRNTKHMRYISYSSWIVDSFFFIYFYLLHRYIWLVLRCSFTVSFTLYMFYCFLLFIMFVCVHIAPILWQVLYLKGYIPCMD
jgi:hypothetical protein